jgi:hypothetical protein
MSRSNKSSQSATSAKVTYEGTVIARAMGRAGRNVHLKGHVHEILTQDSRNLGNLLKGDLLQGQTTRLTRSTTAKAVDLVTTRGGKVIERLQLKDNLSPSSINKLVRQVAEGKYRTTQLFGTEETTQLANAALEKAGLAKRMVSSGHSSQTTTALAQRAGAAGSGTLSGAALQAAKSGGAVGGMVGAGIEAIGGVRDLINGEKTAGEVAGAVAKAGVKGYASGAAASAAATASGAVVAGGLTTVGAGATLTAVATVAAPLVVAAGVGYAVCKAFDWLFDQ